MKEIAKILGYVVCVLFTLSQFALAETPDVSGKWTGGTTCPLGAVTFTIDVNGSTGTFGHDGYGPNKMHPLSFPVKISTKTGWEGEWVYFSHADPNYRGSFNYLNGLLSANGKTLTVRPGVATGDCKGFTLTRNAIPGSQPSSTSVPVDTPPQGRAPTEVKFANLLANLEAGKIQKLDQDSQFFVGGIADILASRCGLPSDPREKQTIVSFLVTLGGIMSTGTDNNGPLDRNWRSQWHANQTVMAGARLAEQKNYDCSSGTAHTLASTIAKSITSGNRGADGNPSAFVSTCSNQFSQAQCECLAQVGQPVIPNIHEINYSRDIFRSLIDKSPMVGLQIAFQCGIGNY